MEKKIPPSCGPGGRRPGWRCRKGYLELWEQKVPRKSYQNGLPIKPRVCCMQYYVNYNTIAIGWAIIWATVYRTGLPWNGHRLNQWASTQSVGIEPISKTQPPISGHRPNTCKDLTLGSTPEGDTKQKATQSRRRRKEATSTTSRRQEQ